MLSKAQLISEISGQVAEDLETQFGLKLTAAQCERYAKAAVRSTLAELEAIADDEISNGNDFTVPGVCRISWRYTPALKKGERHKKGDTYVGFGGQEKVADEDSPARKARVKLAASPTGRVGKNRISKAEMPAFLKSKAGKAIIARKG